MLSDRALARLTMLMPDARVRLAERSQSALYRFDRRPVWTWSGPAAHHRIATTSVASGPRILR